MVDPVIALSVFFGLILLGLLGYWVYRSTTFLQNRKNREKILTEDILKQLYHLEQSGQQASLIGMAGALKVKDKRMLEMIDVMNAKGLIKTDQELLLLTDQGRTYALKMIRTHRLYEQYLSEKTGVDKMEWHDRAEKMEHRLTPEQIEQLDRSLGSPRFDPHGDPIPTAEGELRGPDKQALSTLSEGEYARIIHIEDEPEAIYQQIVGSKLHVGSQVKVLEKDERQITFYCEGESYRFSPIVATNIHIKPLGATEVLAADVQRLSTLEQGEQARILGISAECRGAARRRLLDLGFTPGTLIETELESPMQEPKGFLLRNTLIALRSEQSELIIIEKV